MSGGLFDDQLGPQGFAGAGVGATAAGTPLAERMRPRTLDEVVGHPAVVGENAFLRRAVAEKRIPSLLFWGPPGTGKTTLANLLAQAADLVFIPFSAVTSGIKDVKDVMAEAARRRASRGRGTLLFVDEIHRFNRAQQDAFLPYVERGDIVLVGATTENPSFALNGALLSRCRVIVLEPLGIEELETLLRRALADAERGVAASGIGADDDALAAIAQLSSGDARRALNLLELTAADGAASNPPRITLDTVQRVERKKTLLYDKSGEEHFNLISALHKSLRESHPDAALYWLFRMLAAGEDPRYVARRMLRFASEDIGLADPGALTQTLAAWEAYERLGSPEGDLFLTQACLYLALAPKSNATYRAEKAVKKAIEDLPAEPVPKALRNAPTKLMKEVGYGAGYVYAPDTETGVAGLDCLPPSLAGKRFYEPTERGIERKLKERLAELDRLRAPAPPAGPRGGFPE